jgi:hypothetical protein
MTGGVLLQTRQKTMWQYQVKIMPQPGPGFRCDRCGRYNATVGFLRTRKVAGVRREESDALMRLADVVLRLCPAGAFGGTE